MPIYEYQCKACGHHFELIQKFSDPPQRKCPECGKNKADKLVSAPSFQLKGSGWYVTDFKDKKPAADKTDKPEKAASKSETKQDTKQKAPKDTKKNET